MYSDAFTAYDFGGNIILFVCSYLGMGVNGSDYMFSGISTFVGYPRILVRK